MKVVWAMAVPLVVLACCSAASAAPTRHGSMQGGSFCGTAKADASYLKSTLSITSGGAAAETPANLKLAYTTIAKDEGGLLGTAPKSLKANLRRAFSFINLVKSDFEKVDWQAAKMAPYFPALVAKGTADAKPIAAVEAYLRKTCHLPI